MRLEGSCHCRKVRFTVDAAEPVPFMRCYCSICRKTAGAGGYAINLGAAAAGMKVTGKRYLRTYRASLQAHGYPVVHGWVFDIKSGRIVDLKIDFERILKDIREIYDLTS